MGAISIPFNPAKKNKLSLLKQAGGGGYVIVNPGSTTPLPPTQLVNIYEQGNTFVPSNISSPGTDGQVGSDGNYFYVCVGTDNWIRVPFASW